ncbi:cupin domain-containing protein [Planctobacterium marinum]|uniref:cupin domain-containing protein n=1 Tax=Planctobacterium marinum TaxID=1631968 RepID=UPI001E55E96F|nr:cupin domain-containing protein [Planctobacterium marinum]MCC2603833.1 cupin domain-containing protein [Planctobacterium marinum]
MKTTNLTENFVVVNPHQEATIELADAGLYERLDNQYQQFKGHSLVAMHSFESDWPSWEIHPKGDEIVVLMSGEITMILKENVGDRAVTLRRSGDFVIVPRGVWHTAKTVQKSQLLFITPGEGTENKVF